MLSPVDERTLAELLARVAAGETPVDEALDDLRHMPYEEVIGAKVDHHRELRTGQTEAVYGPGKTEEQVCSIVGALVRSASGTVFVTRATPRQFAAVCEVAPQAEYDPKSGLVVAKRGSSPGASGTVTLVTAGTADMPVAQEAALTAEALGLSVTRVEDVGVAGLHRLLDQRDAIERADCVIVVAGMEGALPSVVSGMTSKPVVAVPTSVGYGASFDGIAALLGMLTACAPGVVVVNIDNGFGAAQAARRIVEAGFRSRLDSGTVPG